MKELNIKLPDVLMRMLKTQGYLEDHLPNRNPKYRYLQLRKDKRDKNHAKGSYPKIKEIKGNFGPVMDFTIEASRRDHAEQLLTDLKGKEKDIGVQLVMMGFAYHGSGLFTKNYWKNKKVIVDLKRKEVKREQRSYPRDTKVQFKEVAIKMFEGYLHESKRKDYKD